jgi:two-component system, response regulator
MNISESQTILIVEDSPEDFEATNRAFRKSKLNNPIRHCTTGEEALDYLFRKNAFHDEKNSPRPGIILLDLNIPGTDGREVLKVIKNDTNLKSIPVIVLTTSNDRHDIDQCYTDGANSYIQKPVDLAKFIEAIQRLKEYWFEISLIPAPEK